ncbi:BlaI/MecI/CopY family transcriptional regulator [Streptomyces sp. CBMA29]|uniref:BlaI/MecI/CopY family transcriptional regulator n=1 Tax=Streptomyces sp. CBMA29 TaxID=1896314 RepID=UPI00166219E3|nr:BlaI/MecI/CopY family transcriptional regulator [Streptomyces sp. CBMA29]MBD0734940.1 CopY family transcriptional regulator [Streptomyces sp. CBMA29]
MNARRSRSPGGLEREVIACLAASGVPMTASQVQAELGGDLAYNTVLTAMTRLYAKQALERSPQGRAFAYRLSGEGAADAEAGVTAHRMHLLLEAGADRTSVLARFVGEMDEETERLLRALLEEAEATGPSGPSGASGPVASEREDR